MDKKMQSIGMVSVVLVMLILSFSLIYNVTAEPVTTIQPELSQASSTQPELTMIKVFDANGNCQKQWEEAVLITSYTKDEITFIDSFNYARTWYADGGTIVAYTHSAVEYK